MSTEKKNSAQSRRIIKLIIWVLFKFEGPYDSLGIVLLPRSLMHSHANICFLWFALTEKLWVLFRFMGWSIVEKAEHIFSKQLLSEYFSWLSSPPREAIHLHFFLESTLYSHGFFPMNSGYI